MGFREVWQALSGANETRIPLCTLPRPKPVEVEYVYVEGEPRSHRLQFRKGRALKFLIGLSRYGEDIERLGSALEHATRPDPADAEGLGFWTRLGLRLLGGGTPVSCREAIEPSTEDQDPLGYRVTRTFRYRVAHVRRGDGDAILLLASVTTESQRRRKTEMSRFRLSVSEADLLAGQLRAFLAATG